MTPARVLTLLLAIPFALCAQNPRWLNFTKTNEFRDIAANDTMIWAATDGGLLCYDKRNGASHLLTRANGNLPINELYSVALAPDGALWIGTPVGVARQSKGAWNLVNPTPDDPVCGPWSYGRKVRSDGQNGVWWLGVKGYLWHFDGQQWTGYDPETTFQTSRISDFEVRPDGKLWVFSATHDAETFYLFDGVTAQNWGFTGSLPDPPGSRKVYDWTVDGEGDLWFVSGNQIGVPDTTTGSWVLTDLTFWPDQICAGANGAIWAIDAGKLYQRQSNGSWAKLPLPNFNMEYGEPLFADTDGRPLFYNSDRELLHYNGAGFDTLRYAGHDMPNNSVARFAITGDQTIWASFDEDLVVGWLNGRDLARFENGKWTSIPPAVSDSMYLSAFADLKTDADGTLWVAGLDKLARFDGNTWKAFKIPELPWGQVLSLGVPASGSPVWLGGQDAIARFDVSTGKVITFTPPHWAGIGGVNNIETDHSGNVWMAAYHKTEGRGMLRFDGSEWTFFSVAGMNLEPYNYVQDFTIGPDGRVWVLTNTAVAVFDGNSWSKFTAGFPYLGEYISIAFDGEVVWLGCYANNCFSPNIYLSLLKIENGHITYFPYTSYPLPYPNITALAVDGYHNLWIGGEKGGIAVMREAGVVLDAPGRQTHLPRVSARLAPNPAGQSVRVQYTAARGGDARFELMDLQGRTVFRLRWETPSAGQQERLLNLPPLPAGIYAWQLAQPGGNDSGKLLLTGN